MARIWQLTGVYHSSRDPSLVTEKLVVCTTVRKRDACGDVGPRHAASGGGGVSRWTRPHPAGIADMDLEGCQGEEC